MTIDIAYKHTKCFGYNRDHMDNTLGLYIYAIASQITSLTIVYSTKENIKAPRDWPLCGEFTGDRQIPRTNGQ